MFLQPITLSLLAAGPVIDLSGQAQSQGLQFSTGNSFGDFISRILQIVMTVGVLAVFIFLVWGALDWITAGGEKGKIDAARNKITGSIIGLIILACTVAIFMLLQNFLGVHVFSVTG